MGWLSGFLGAGTSAPSEAGRSGGGAAGDASRYYALLESLLDWQAKHQYARMLDYCAQSLPLLPALVADCRRQYGSFDLSSIPAIEIGCRYWAALGDTESLDAVSTAVQGVPAIKSGWSDVVKSAYSDAALARRITDYVRDHPGALQNRMGKALEASGRDTSRVIGTLTNLGILVRTAAGKTYELSLAQG
jgi:hypothetical protein